ncbi:MAG: glutamate 5-kinase [Patescibacteria group bacterium]
MYHRIIVKIGTSVVTNAKGELDLQVLKRLVEETAQLRKKNTEVVIVTSGAVGTGRGMVTLKDESDSVVKKQIFAAVGQVKLMSTYAEYFAKEGIVCAQVLATKEDFRDREHYSHMKNCIENLLRNDVIPVVNENDVVAVAELVFTDNDELAGLLASQLNVNAVFFLTGIDGVMDRDWKKGNAKVIPEISLANIDSFEKHITEEKSDFSRGGMRTKFEIAKKLARDGITTHIANGKVPGILMGLDRGLSIGTKFLPK